MKRLLTVGALLVPLVAAGCVAGPAPAPAPAEQDREGVGHQTADELIRVTEPHVLSGGTLLEGPVFDDEGRLFLVDVMAPPGEPKVLRVDVGEETVEAIYTDEASVFTSAQISPADGRLYLTDGLGGSVQSMLLDGTDPRTLFSGDIDGTAMLPDDLAFDPEGNLYISDIRGVEGPGWETLGRVVRVSAEGDATVLASDLASPNGISFDEDYAGLWVAQYYANRIDYFALDETRTEVTAAYPGMYVDGGKARVDSTAVDADGNVYQGFHLKPEIHVYSPKGDLLAVIAVPEDAPDLDTATNIAIEPGTTDGVITVSGPDGGYLYTFEALAEGTRQSNGG
ncbi:SMP-30/gluconolactonase/LRE family protein [Glycomyces buryatensis]|uniref:SMP-30/gluconolactonase/LRE family protein n=1 Tax=Glycomyces buryatensis TaxID=2570927 RepID=UPI001B3C1795|nr:SMP-30/gluconolactonase/LRE family protein [Glycomyces buryatensis]